jgi:Mn-dependent DtxR family transcriptional regulator
VGEKMPDNDFYTFNEYMKNDESHLTPSMEDYLEMIYRLSQKNGFTRINELSSALNVQPPSATKMVQKLADIQLIKYEKYGVIFLEEKGKQAGEGLLKRHNVVEDFLKLLGLKNGILEETEKIEHTINSETLKCIENMKNFLKEHPEIVDEYTEYCKSS